MRLYLMRHGQAKERAEWDGPDHSRPLTLKGRREVRAVARALARERQVQLDALWTSPFLRARQTAELVGEVLGVPVVACESLACGVTLEGLSAALAPSTPPERLLMTGHEPDLGELLGQLTGGTSQPFSKAGVACLEGRFRAAGMKLRWHLSSKELRGEA